MDRAASRSSMSDLMLQMRTAVQENIELKKQVAILEEANSLMRRERLALFERLAAAEAEIQALQGGNQSSMSPSGPVPAVSDKGSRKESPASSSVETLSEAAVVVSVSAPKSVSPAVLRLDSPAVCKRDLTSPRLAEKREKRDAAADIAVSAKRESPAQAAATMLAGVAATLLRSESLKTTQTSLKVDALASPVGSAPTSPRGGGGGGGGEAAALKASALISPRAPQEGPPEETGPSPRFEPLEDFASPALSRDSSRRRPPPPPPAASPTPAPAGTTPGGVGQIASASSQPSKTVPTESGPDPNVRNNFFKSSLKNTFGRSSKRSEEDQSRGSSRNLLDTPTLGRGSVRPAPAAAEAPMSPQVSSVPGGRSPRGGSNEETMRLQPEVKCLIGEVTQVSDGFKKVALYMITVTSRDGDEWKVARRYNQFLTLYQELQAKTSRSLVFPPKKFTLTMDQSKLKQRTAMLQKFLDQVLDMTNLTSTMEFMRFVDPLESPSVLSLSYQDVALSSDALMQVVEVPPFHQQLERQERYLMLVGSKLFVFRDEMSVDALHTVSLVYCVADLDGKVDADAWGFTIKHLTRIRPLSFEGDEDECRKWVAAIRQARASAGGGALAVQMPEKIQATSAGSAEETEGKGAAVLRRFAHGKSVRLSTFNTVPDTVASLMGTFSFSVADAPENVLFKDGVLAAATIEKLIEKLTLPDCCARQHVQYFLLTYRATLSPQELLAFLLARYHHSDLVEARKVNRAVGLQRNAVHDRVVLVLELWLELGFQDFVEDGDLTARLMSFVYSALEGNILMNDGAERIKDVVKRRVLTTPSDAAAEHERFLEAHAPKSLLPNMLGVGMSYLVDVDPLEIARQLAILDHDLFCKIRGQELIGQKWSKESLRPLAPNVMAVIGRFNALSSWVVTLILQPSEAVIRAALVARLTTIGSHLKELRAYGPASAIVGGLLSPAVMRLKKTSELADANTTASLKILEQLISPEKNHKHYRELLQQTLQERSTPCCPYLGLYLADLTFIEDGNPDKRGDMINFDKRCMLGKVLAEILRFQSARYALRPVPALQWFLANAGSSSLTEKQAYDLSLEREPREEKQH